MGVDCVFWIKLDVSGSGAACVQRLRAEILANGCPMMPTEAEIESDATIVELLGYRLYRTPTDAEAAAAILHEHTRKVELKGTHRFSISPSYFAYCNLAARAYKPDWVSLCDGCRYHLNLDYQAEVIAWLKLHTGSERVFVLGDDEPDPTD